MKKLNLVFTRLSQFLLIAFASAGAHAQYDIGTAGEGPLDFVVEMTQYIVNVVDGPFALAFAFFSLVGMAIAWVGAKQFGGIFATCAKVFVAVIIILNVGTWIAYMAGN